MIKGTVPMTGTIAPTDVLDVYPVTDEQWNLGGYRTVNTIVERDAISLERQKIGMIVYVLEDEHWYQLFDDCGIADWKKALIAQSEDADFFPEVGRSNTLYIDTGTNAIYRWDGEKYVMLFGSGGSAQFVVIRKEYTVTEDYQTDFSTDAYGILVFLNGLVLQEFDEEENVDDYELIPNGIRLSLGARINDVVKLIGSGTEVGVPVEGCLFPSETLSPSQTLIPSDCLA